MTWAADWQAKVAWPRNWTLWPAHAVRVRQTLQTSTRHCRQKYLVCLAGSVLRSGAGERGGRARGGRAGAAGRSHSPDQVRWLVRRCEWGNKQDCGRRFTSLQLNTLGFSSTEHCSFVPKYGRTSTATWYSSGGSLPSLSHLTWCLVARQSLPGPRLALQWLQEQSDGTQSGQPQRSVP